MAETVGQAKVEVSADVSRAENALKRLQADFDRSMAEIGRKKAEAKVTADTTELERKLVTAKRELKNLEDSKAEVSVTGDIKQWEIAVARVRAQIKELNLQKAEITVDSHELRDANREAGLAEGKLKSMAQASDKAMAASKRLEQAKAAETKTIRDYSVAQSRAIADDTRRTETTLKNAVALDKLRTTYAKLEAEQKTMVPGSIFDRLFGHSGAEKQRISELDNEMKLTEHRIRSLGGDLSNLGDGGSGGGGGQLLRRIGNWITGFTKMRFSMGPLSGTIAQFGVAIAALGPIILSLAGGLGALVGVVGTGLVGALSAAGTAAAGFGLSAAGIGLAIKPAISQLQAGMAASKAYEQAVLKYGKGSTQAATASKNLATTLKGVSPAARSAIKDFGGVDTQWTKLTAPTRTKFFDLVGQGLRSVSALMPTFAKQTNATMGVLTTGVDKWFKALRSPAGKSAISGLMSDFRNMLPGLLAGFGNLATVFANIAQAAGHFLGPIGQGFQQWTAHLASATSAGTGFGHRLGTMIHQAGDLVKLFGAAGRALITFFSAGAGSGDKMVRELTKTINGWDRWMKTIGGQNSLHQFFATGAQDTSNFFQALAPLVASFVHLLHALQPVTSGILAFAAGLAKLVGWLGGVKELRIALEGIGVVIGAAFVINKISGWVTALRGAAAAVEALAVKWGLVEGAAGGAAVAEDAATISSAGGAGKLALGGAAATTTGEVAGLTTATDAAAVSIGSLAAPIVALAIPMVAIGIVAGNTADAWDKARGAFKSSGREARGLAAQLTPLGRASVDTNHAAKASAKGAADAQAHYNQVVREFGKGSPQAVLASQRLTQAQQAAAATNRAAVVVKQQDINVQRASHQAAMQHIADARAEIKAIKSENTRASMGRGVISPQQQQANAQKLAQAQKDLSAAQQQAQASSDALFASEVAVARQQQGLQPITDALAQSLIKVKDAIGGAAAKKLGQIVDPQQAQQATNLANRLDNLGAGSTVHQVVVNSKGGDQTVAQLQRLQRLVIGDKSFKVLIHGDNGVLAGLQKIDGFVMRDKLQKIGQSGAQGVLGALGNVRNAANKVPTAVNIQVNAFVSGAISSLQAVQTAAQNALNAIQQVASSKPHHRVGGPATMSRSTEGTQLAVMNNRSSKVSRPSMVVGEEAPQHPEYVIATNPAYRQSNVVYLDQAAGALGYDLVPAYAGGKGQKFPNPHNVGQTKHATKAISAMNVADVPGLNADALTGPNSTYAQLHRDISYQELRASADSSSQSSAADSTTQIAWINDAIAAKSAEIPLYEQLSGTLKGIIHDLNIGEAKGGLKDLPKKGKKKIPKVVGKSGSKAQKESQKRHDAAVAYNAAVDNYNQNLNQAQQAARQSEPDLKEELAEIPLMEQQVNADIAALTATLTGVQTADAAQPGIFNAARQDLYRQFGSNAIAIVGSGVTGNPTMGPSLTSPGFAAGSTGIDVSGAGSVSSSGNQPGLAGQGDTIINMQNTFANVPPDPHSWSRQAAFELQAI